MAGKKGKSGGTRANSGRNDKYPVPKEVAETHDDGNRTVPNPAFRGMDASSDDKLVDTAATAKTAKA